MLREREAGYKQKRRRDESIKNETAGTFFPLRRHGRIPRMAMWLTGALQSLKPVLPPTARICKARCNW